MHKSRNTSARKVGTAPPFPAKSLIYGGSDGTRTRDLRRDSPCSLTCSQIEHST
jgi:hypothetical protein